MRTARENHRMLGDFRRRAIGDADGCRLKPASCSKLFHASCETQGPSARTSSSNSHQPFSSPKIEVMNSQGRVSSTITSVPPDPSSCLIRSSVLRRSAWHAAHPTR